MAIAEMSKLNLIAMSYDKDVLLNALNKTGATEIKLQRELENTFAISSDCQSLRDYVAKTEAALESLSEEAAEYVKTNKIKTDELDDGFFVTYSEFMSVKDKKAEADLLVDNIYKLLDEKRALYQEQVKLQRTLENALSYSKLNLPFKMFTQTASTCLMLGTVTDVVKQTLTTELKKIELCDFAVCDNLSDDVLLLVVAHKSVKNEVNALLQNAGFVACPYSGEQTGDELYQSLLEQKLQLTDCIKQNADDMYALSGQIKMLKVYCDYLNFELEKAEANDKMRATEVTFLLEAYVPSVAIEEVKAALDGATNAVYYEFSQPGEDETPPTLYKNNAVVKNFETITDMYSPANYREFDPNTVMAVFYSLFLGFIMADIGYGILMLLGGGLLWYKFRSKKSTVGSLSGVFAIGGIFAIVWGVLFNSCFGFALLPFKVMPDLQGENMSWSLAGIKVPALLIISMIIGVVQIFTGYVCRAVQCWRRGQILDGIFDGVVWAVFSVGVVLAIIGFVDEFNLSVLATVGGIIAGASLLVAVLTAGRKEKLLGKFTKGFGAAYGVINYASDILSYARLYGLMLAGAVIADIITSNSITLISSGNIGFAVLGVVIILIGHIFNLAIGLLGAYIHDARLQYVEFYGRFYEGEGRLFAPLGSNHKYVCVTD